MALFVKDLETSFDFYVNRLGFTRHHEPRDGIFVVRCTDGDLLLCFDETVDEVSSRLGERHAIFSPGELLVFANSDVEQIAQQFERTGVTAESSATAWGTNVIRLTDPEGYRWKWVSPNSLNDEQLVELYASAPSVLSQALDRLDNTRLDVAADDGWSVRMLTHHICDGDLLWAGTLMAAMISPGAKYSHDWYVDDRACADALRYATRDIGEARRLFAAMRDHFVKVITTTPGALDRNVSFRRHYESAANTLTVRDILLQRAQHTLEHVDEIRDRT
jgi:catechol 2,3-dioxygenase-like lactoylglutathione lyase family enzyme